jgi:crotonobetaine/carnitine-CoA ligase
MPQPPVEAAPLPASSIGALVAARATAYPDRELLRFEGRSLGFAQVAARSARAANALAGLGIGRGDRVAIMLPNGLDFPLLWLGVVRLGAVVVPCNPAYQSRDLGFVLADSGARLLLTDPERLAVAGEARASCPELQEILLLGDPGSLPAGAAALEPLLAAAAAEWRDDRVGPGDLATLQYTSGTTGFPKGCMLSHEYWLRLGAGAAGGIRLRQGDVNLVMTAWFYLDAGWNFLLCCLEGIPLVILPRFSASTFWRSVVDNGVTFFYCLGTIPVLLLKQPENPALERGHRVRLVLCSAIPPQLHAAIEARFGCPWREAYSTTEIGPVCLTVPPDDAASVGSGAVGRPSPGSEARVADAEGRDVPPGEIGELLVRGPGMMLGYWRNPEATAAWLRGGWAHTGDLVFRDERGHFHVVGRIKDMIRRGGENVAAAEVEAILAEHPSVRAAACVAVPDPVRGEEVKAFLQLQPGVPPEAATAEAVLAYCRSKLAGFKVPRYVAFVAEFPLTPSQRIEKHRLDRTPAGAYDGAAHSLPRQP